MIKPYYQQDGVTLYCGDCLEILPNLELVDLVFADPPFNVGIDYGDSSDDKRHDYNEWSRAWIEQCFEHLADYGSFYLKNLPRHIDKFVPILSKWQFISLVVWPNASDAFHMERKYYPKYELIYVYGKTENYIFNQYAERLSPNEKSLRWGGYRTKAQGQVTDIWDDIPFVYAGSIHHKEAIMKPRTNEKAHPTQMPEGLVKRAIVFSSPGPGACILDPFVGSGTTLFAAKQLGCKAIGIEIEEKYCEIAAKRCSQMVMNLEIP